MLASSGMEKAEVAEKVGVVSGTIDDWFRKADFIRFYHHELSKALAVESGERVEKNSVLLRHIHNAIERKLKAGPDGTVADLDGMGLEELVELSSKVSRELRLDQVSSSVVPGLDSLSQFFDEVKMVFIRRQKAYKEEQEIVDAQVEMPVLEEAGKDGGIRDTGSQKETGFTVD